MKMDKWLLWFQSRRLIRVNNLAQRSCSIPEVPKARLEHPGTVEDVPTHG